MSGSGTVRAVFRGLARKLLKTREQETDVMTVFAVLILNPAALMDARAVGVLCAMTAVAVVILWTTFRSHKRD